MSFLVSNTDFSLVSKNSTRLLGNLFGYHQCYLKSFKECLCVKFYPGFSSCFPDTKLLICLHQALRSFRREVTREKISILSAQRNSVLEIRQSIAHTNNEKAYKVNLKLLQNTKLHAVVDHFMENWDLKNVGIKKQWVMFYKDQSFNLGETANNRMESAFRNVKNICTKYAS